MLLDEVEWVTDSTRAAELGLDPDLPGGGYDVYNETELDVVCYFAEDCSFALINWTDNYDNSTEPVQVDRQTFLDMMAKRADVYNTWSNIYFIIEIRDGKIVNVTEQAVQ